MANKKEVSVSVSKIGMNKDKHISALGPEEYTHAKNSNFEDDNGNSFNIQNEHSNLLASKYKDGFKVVGVKKDLFSNNTYFFLTNPSNNISEIGKIENVNTLPDLGDTVTNCGGCEYRVNLSEPLEEQIQQETQEYKTILNDSCNKCLNFDVNHPIKSIEIKNEKCGSVIYFTDNHNPPRYIQIEELEQYAYTGEELCGDDSNKEPICVACDKMLMFKPVDIFDIVPSSIVIGGSLKKGTYEFIAAYSDESGNELSRYFSITNPISIFDRNRVVMDQKDIAEETNYAIKLTVEGLDKDFTHYKVAVIQVTDINRATSYFVEGVHSTSDNTVLYTTDKDKERTNLNSLMVPAVRAKKWETLSTSNGYLFGNGVTFEKRMNLQPVVNLMGQFLKWQSYIAKESLYKEGIASSKYRGYYRGETYPLSIRFLLDGEYTAIFPFIGRPSTDEDLITLDASSNKDVESVNKLKGSCTDTEITKKWQLYDTSEETGTNVPEEGIETNIVVEEERKTCYINPSKETYIEVTGYKGKGTIIIKNNDSSESSYPITFITDEGTTASNFVTSNKTAISTNHNGLIVENLGNLILFYGDDTDYKSIDYVEEEKGLNLNIKTNNYLKRTGEGSFTITLVDNEDFIDVETFIKNHQEDCARDSQSYDFCSLLDINNYPEQCMPDFGTNCTPNPARLIEEEIQLVDIIGESLTKIEKVFPDQYPKIKAPEQTRMYETDVKEGGVKEDLDFTMGYLVLDYNEGANDISVVPGYDRAYNYTNNSCDYPDTISEFTPVTNYTRGYFFNTMGSDLMMSVEDGNTESEMVDTLKSNTNSLTQRGDFIQGKFTDKIHEGALWFKKRITEEEGKAIINISRQKTPDEKGYESTNNSNEEENKLVRLTLFSTCTSDPVFDDYIDMTQGAMYKAEVTEEDELLLHVVDSTTGQITVKNLGFIIDKTFYIAIDVPLIIATGINTDENGDLLYSRKVANDFWGSSVDLYDGIKGDPHTEIRTRYRNLPTAGYFSVVSSSILYSEVEVDFADILIAKTQKYISSCSTEVPVLKNCEAFPYKHGKFAYTESTEIYPDNEDLYDSSALNIEPSDIPEGVIGTDSTVTYKQYFQENYAESALNPKGGYKWKEDINGPLSDFRCRQIRHFKMPDSKVSPFMYENSLPDFTESVIYPLGVTIDKNIINSFLDIALKNKLITKEQRAKIKGYEILRGDRTTNKGVLAKGITFDMMQYEEDDQDIRYANYPFNDLGEDVLNYQDGNRNNFVNHPYEGEKNESWTFHSPDTDYNKGISPSILKVDGYMYGKSRGYFSEVRDHPEYVILGRRLENLASTLATAEVAAEVFIQSSMALSHTNSVAGTSTTVFPGGIIASGIIAGSTLITGALFKYSRYKYEWLQTFKNLGAPKNFASYYSAEGFYNNFKPEVKEYNEVRFLDTAKNIQRGRLIVTDEVDGTKMDVNHVDREDTMLLSTGKKFPIEYTTDYKDYDNSSINRGTSSRTIASDSNACDKGISKKVTKNVSSMYVTLKNYLPSQYGEIGSVQWLTTGRVEKLDENLDTPYGIFGGDVFITRHTLKRSMPLFVTTAMGTPSLSAFDYKKYSNIGEEPRYYLNYEVNNKDTSSSRPIPSKTSDYSLDCLDFAGEDYVEDPAKFYLYYHGVPNFLVESTINTWNRYAGPEPWNNFYPNSGDLVEWTQEVVNPIKKEQEFKYNSAYSKNVTQTAVFKLPLNYDKEKYDCFTDMPNGTMYSEQDRSENRVVDPWLIFKPLNKYEFETSYGKLIEMRGVENRQMLARFENTALIFNAVDTLVDNGVTAEIGDSGVFEGFRRRPRTFTDTDLGYMGTQTKAMVSCEFGHFYADAKRGQVFKIAPGGQGYEEISSVSNGQPTGMKSWFKKHLPFKITKQFPEADVDNPYNGIGITMGWDSVYKRVFLTKRDYIAIDKTNLIECEGVLKTTEQSAVDKEVLKYEAKGWTFLNKDGCGLNFEKPIENTSKECLEGMKFKARYSRSGGPCHGGHICNEAYYNIVMNNIVVGEVSLNNNGGTYDLKNYPPGITDPRTYDRYVEVVLTEQQMQEVLAVDDLINISFECACQKGVNCDEDTCHEGLTWLQVEDKKGNLIYDNCPVDNFLSEFNPCKTTVDTRVEEVTVPLPNADLNNPLLFKDVSWTISYNLKSGKWGSFFDFKPNYYVNHNGYFQTGSNIDTEEFGLWSHLLTNKSFGVFNGKRYPWEIEIPIPNKNVSKYIETFTYDLDVRRYHNEYDYSENDRIGFEEVVISNHNNNSGKLNLEVQKTISQVASYPKTSNNQQTILQVSDNGNFTFNYFYNRVKDKSNGLPLWLRDENEIDKKLNNEAISFYNKTVLGRLKGDTFLVNLKSNETQHKKIFKISKTKENLYN